MSTDPRDYDRVLGRPRAVRGTGQAASPPQPRQDVYPHSARVQQIATANAGRRKLFVQNRGGAAVVLGTARLTPDNGIRVGGGEFFSDDENASPSEWYFRTVGDVVVIGDTIIVREESA